MIEKVAHIKNPLTVIAIFSAVAEISGTTVLPFIAPQNQSIYIWFLMLFPTLLVFIFFLTLNFNHKVLYAPSDYKDENNFLKSFRIATAQEKIEKLREEIEEAEPSAAGEEAAVSDDSDQPKEAEPSNTVKINIPSEMQESHTLDDYPAPPSPNSPPPIFSRSQISERHAASLANYALAEKLSIFKLSKDLNMDFKNDVRFQLGKNRHVIFDGLAVKGNEIHGIEVKLFTNPRSIKNLIENAMNRIAMVSQKIKDESEKEFVFHFVAVIENQNISEEFLRSKLVDFLDEYKFKIQIHVFTISDLKNEYEYRF